MSLSNESNDDHIQQIVDRNIPLSCLTKFQNFANVRSYY
jgi:hypothetical protein